jgi:small GTP-binding protein
LGFVHDLRAWHWLVEGEREGWDRERIFVLNLRFDVELAQQIASLRQLEKLAIVGFGLRDKEAAQIVNHLRPLELHSLNLSRSQVGVETARALAEQTHLQTLDLSSNALGDEGARALGGLKSLKTLSLGTNRIGVVGARALSGLAGLSTLDLHDNGLGDDGAKELAALTQLEDLGLGRNRIGPTGAKALARLRQLRCLDLTGNNLKDEGAHALLGTWVAARVEIERLALLHNDIALFPIELLANGDGAGILDHYGRCTDARGEPLNEAKLLVVGAPEVGKTSLVRYLKDNLPRDEDERATDGCYVFQQIETVTWSPKGSPCTLNIWDFGGQEILYQTHKFFMTERSIYLLVLNDREGDRARTSVDEWLPIIRSRGRDSPVLIVINKSDDAERYCLDLDETGLKQTWPTVVKVLRTSCCKGSDDLVDALRREIVKLLNEHPQLEHVRDPIPAAYRRVKEGLARLARDKRRLRLRDFEQLCEAGEGEDRILGAAAQMSLLRLLDDLGVVIAPGLREGAEAATREYALLDPNWLTTAMYGILWNVLVAHRGGTFLRAELPKMLNPAVYPPDSYEQILDMMMHEDVGLCFEIPDTRPPEFLVPVALPPNAPYYGFLEATSLRLRFCYEYLPVGLIPRLIFKSHSLLTPEPTRWQTGAVFHTHGCDVLVRADRSKKLVDIFVAGPIPLRPRALAVITEKLRDVHELNPECVPTPMAFLPGASTPTVLYEHLLEIEIRKGSDYEFLPHGGKRMHTVREIIEGVACKRPRLKILFVCSSPASYPMLRLGKEQKIIRNAVEGSGGALDLTVVTAATPRDLQEAFAEQDYQVLHISGYGTNAGPVLETDGGEPTVVRRRELADYLRDRAARGSLACVVLNCCHSLLTGEDLANQVFSVVTMDGKTSDSASLEFTYGFYRELAKQTDFEQAHRAGCDAARLSVGEGEFNPKFNPGREQCGDTSYQ